jgi:chemotaxis protein CheX
MNVKYINPLLESTLSVLSTMAMIEAKPGKPSLKEGTHTLGDVTGLIDLSENGQTRASLAIGFSADAIYEIGKNMLGEEMTSIDDAAVDMVGELTNMITGAAKRIYAEQGLEFELTLPKTTVGSGTPIEHSVPGNAIVLPFSTGKGQLYVELCFGD